MTLSLSTIVVLLGPPVILRLLVLAPREQTADGSASRVVSTWGKAFLVCSDGPKAFPSA